MTYRMSQYISLPSNSGFCCSAPWQLIIAMQDYILSLQAILSLVFINTFHLCVRVLVSLHMIWFLFTVVEEPSTVCEEVNDSRSVHCTVGNTFTSSPSSCYKELSENALVNNDTICEEPVQPAQDNIAALREEGVEKVSIVGEESVTLSTQEEHEVSNQAGHNNDDIICCVCVYTCRSTFQRSLVTT